MNDKLKDIVYSDLFRYTGNARRTKHIYTTYLQELRSSPEFHYISLMRRTKFYEDAQFRSEAEMTEFVRAFDAIEIHHAAKEQFEEFTMDKPS